MYQKITVVGYVGRDPEMRYLPDGTAVTNFSIATSRKYNDSRSNQQVDETTWFRISVFGRRAEVANQYISKGSRVLVEGRMSPDKETGGPRLWTRQDGSVAASYEIRATDFTFLSSREESAQMANQMSSAPAQQGGGSGGGGFDSGSGSSKSIEEDDIPF